MSSLSTQAWPPPAPYSSWSPWTSAASLRRALELVGEGQRADLLSSSLISYVMRVYGSAAIPGSMSIRNVWTSLCGGSASTTSPSMITSGSRPPERASALLPERLGRTHLVRPARAQVEVDQAGVAVPLVSTRAW